MIVEVSNLLFMHIAWVKVKLLYSSNYDYMISLSCLPLCVCWLTTIFLVYFLSLLWFTLFWMSLHYWVASSYKLTCSNNPSVKINLTCLSLWERRYSITHTWKKKHGGRRQPCDYLWKEIWRERRHLCSHLRSKVKVDEDQGLIEEDRDQSYDNSFHQVFKK